MKYLETIAALKQHAIAELGPMTTGTYASFLARATQLASKAGVRRPKLILGLIYNDQKKNLVGIKATPYPISEKEWSIFISDISEYFESTPIVYVVDGDKFTAPI